MSELGDFSAEAMGNVRLPDLLWFPPPPGYGGPEEDAMSTLAAERGWRLDRGEHSAGFVEPIVATLEMIGSRWDSGLRVRRGQDGVTFEATSGDWREDFLRILDWLDERSASPAMAALVTKETERLCKVVFDALEANGRLVRELDRARIDIDFLRAEVNQLRAAVAMGRPRLVRKVLGVLGVTLALAAPLAEGAASGVAEAVTAARINPTAAADVDAGELLLQCEALDERLAQFTGDSFPRAREDR